MEKFYSKVKEGVLLHVVYRLHDFNPGRVDIIPPDEFIQCAALEMNAGKTFRPHKHFEREVTDKDRMPQESWVVIKGRVKVALYDLDDTIIAQPILYEGDASFTLHGGHNYKVVQDNTIVYEFKTGRYLGQANDKIFIE
jgi:hypothetical protein